MQIGRLQFGDSRVASAAVLAAGILAMAVIGMASLAHPDRAFTSGDASYVRMARTVAEGGPFGLETASGAPELHRTPGYPLFVAAAAPWKGMGALRLLLALQGVLALCTAGLLVDAARLAFDPPGRARPLFAAALWICNPVVLVLTFQVLSEILFAFLLALSLWLSVRARRSRRSGFHVAAGLALGGAILVRPIGLLLLLAGAGAWLAARHQPAEASGHLGSGRLTAAMLGGRAAAALCRGRAAAAMLRGPLAAWLAGAILLPGIWMLHNGIEHGYWGISKTGVSFAYSAYGEQYLAARVETESLNSYDTGNLTARGALAAVARSISRHPAAFARTWLEGLSMTLIGPGEWTLRRALLGDRSFRPGTPAIVTTLTQAEGGLVIGTSTVADPEPPPARSSAAWLLLTWSIIITLVTYGAALRGALAGLRRRDAVAIYCLLAIVFLVLGSSGYQAHARFRVPMIPYLALLAAAPHAPPYRRLSRNPSLIASRSSSSRKSG